MKLLLDADVLIGALDGRDPHRHRARELFTEWRDHQDACAVSVVNLTEVLIAPSADVSKLAAAREAIAALGVTVHQPNEATGIKAARLRQRHPISLPDGYCFATAKHASSAVCVGRSEDPHGGYARGHQERLAPADTNETAPASRPSTSRHESSLWVFQEVARCPSNPQFEQLVSPRKYHEEGNPGIRAFRDGRYWARTTPGGSGWVMFPVLAGLG